MDEEHDKHGFPLAPTDVRPGETWFYEGKSGLTVVHRVPGSIRTIEIPWKKLELTIQRYRRFKRKKDAARIRADQ